jgi:proteasome alpha subunit
MGGQADTITTQVTGAHRRDLTLSEALRLAVRALGSVGGETGRPRELTAAQLEVAVLDRARRTRRFKRIAGAALAGLLPNAAPTTAELPDGEAGPDTEAGGEPDGKASTEVEDGTGPTASGADSEPGDDRGGGT